MWEPALRESTRCALSLGAQRDGHRDRTHLDSLDAFFSVIGKKSRKMQLIYIFNSGGKYLRRGGVGVGARDGNTDLTQTPKLCWSQVRFPDKTFLKRKGGPQKNPRQKEKMVYS